MNFFSHQRRGRLLAAPLFELPKHNAIVDYSKGAALCSAPTGMKSKLLRQLNFDVHARWKVESHQFGDGARIRFDDVDQTLVRSHLEVLH